MTFVSVLEFRDIALPPPQPLSGKAWRVARFDIILSRIREHFLLSTENATHKSKNRFPTAYRSSGEKDAG